MHDVWLIHYPEGSYIPPHIDEVDRYRHYRLNIVLREAVEGGDFEPSGLMQPFINTRRVKFFRPDRIVHGVKKIVKGTRLVLSIGWALKKKRPGPPW